MLPTLTTFSDEEVTRFLYLGIDLYEVQRDGRELFVPFNGKLSRAKKYFITCDDQEVMELLLTSDACNDFLAKVKAGMMENESGYFTSMCLRPFSKINLMKFLTLVQEVTKDY